MAKQLNANFPYQTGSETYNPQYAICNRFQNGPISFSDYMALALYDPENGYYSSGRAQIGRHGDFFTNISVGSLFAELIGSQFYQVWVTWKQPSPFIILEQGAHDGAFAADLLRWAQQTHPQFYDAITYWIVEPSFLLRNIQQKQLHLPKVRHFSSLEEVPTGITGIFFGNELIDAFPVHLVIKAPSFSTQHQEEGKKDENGHLEATPAPVWLERYVTWSKDHFEFCDQKITNPALIEAVKNLPLNLPDGYQTEIRICHRPWLQTLSRIWANGILFLCDYGFNFDIYYSPTRTTGTLQCYYRHQRTNNPLLNPGQQDITAHVDFTTLTNDAIRYGFTSLGLVDQHHALVGAAEPWLHSINGQPVSQANQRKLRQFSQLSHPNTMGTQFHFLILQHGPANTPKLNCLRYARSQAGNQ